MAVPITPATRNDKYNFLMLSYNIQKREYGFTAIGKNPKIYKSVEKAPKNGT